jgi:hypothetical protein
MSIFRLRSRGGPALVAAILVATLFGCATSSTPTAATAPPAAVVTVAAPAPPPAAPAVPPPVREPAPAPVAASAPGASSADGKGGKTSPGVQRTDLGATGGLVAITPLSVVKDSWSDPSSTGAMFSGAYTKILVVSKLSSRSLTEMSGNPSTSTGAVSESDGGGKHEADQVKVLAYEPRSPLARALWGRDFNVALTAKLHIQDSVELVIPLAIVGHQSNSAGETWVRELDMSRADFPLFLFRSDGTSTPTVTVEVKGSNSISSRGAAAGLSAITSLAKLAGAAPSVITKLTESSTKAASQAVDSAISKLMDSSVTERYVSDRDLLRWVSPDAEVKDGLIVEFRLPAKEDDWQSTAGAVGRWAITFARPRPSIFYDWSVCPEIASDKQSANRCSGTLEEARAKVASNVSSSDVLHYKLVANANGLGEVDSYVRQQRWFTDAVVDLSKTNPDAKQKDRFCQSVVESITGLGLNEFDGLLVLRAINEGMPSGLAELSGDGKCKSLLDRVKPTASQTTGASPPAPAKS